MIPRDPATAYTGGDAFGGGQAFVLTATQRKALDAIVAEHERTLARQEEWTLVGTVRIPDGWGDKWSRQSRAVRPATVRALERMGALKVRVLPDTVNVLRRGSYGRWIGGTVNRSVTSMQVIPTPDEFARRAREERKREQVRAQTKARRTR